LFNTEKRRLPGHLIAAFQCLKGAYKKYRDKLYSRACCGRTNANSFQLKESRFRPDIKKKIFTVKVVKQRHRLPRGVVDAPFVETFKLRLDGAQSSLIQLKMSLLAAWGLG